MPSSEYSAENEGGRKARPKIGVTLPEIPELLGQIGKEEVRGGLGNAEARLGFGAGSSSGECHLCENYEEVGRWGLF